MASQTWVFTHDTYLDEANPDTNYGTETNVEVGYIYDKGYLSYYVMARVDFSGVIPAGSTINAARIELDVMSYTMNWPTALHRVYRGTDYTWAETYPTWTNSAASIDGTIYDESDPVFGGGLEYYLDATNVVADAIANRSSVLNIVILVYEVLVESCTATWYSSEAVNFQHRLYIDWTPPGGHVKKFMGVALADIKKINGVAIADIAKINGEATS